MTTAPNRRWLRYSLWALLAGSMVLIAVLVYMIGSAHQLVMTAVRNSYAVSWVSEMVVDHMKTHYDAWPTGWEDLKESYHNVAKQASDPRPPDYPWSFDELQSRVEVDWKADPKVLATAQRKNDQPPFKVIWLKDGSNAHWSGLEPNERVLEYLRNSRLGVGDAQRDPRSAPQAAKMEAQLQALPNAQFKFDWPLASVAITVDGQYLAAADTARGVALWKVSTREKLWEIELPSVGAISGEDIDLGFTPDGKCLLLASFVRDPLVLDSTTGATLRSIGRRGEWFAASVSTFRMDDEVTALTAANGNLYFWKPSDGTITLLLRELGRGVVSLCCSANASRVALGVEEGPQSGRVIVRELPSGKSLLEWARDGIPASDIRVVIAPDGERVVVSFGESLECWSVEDKRALWTAAEPCRGLAISPSGRTILYGAATRIVLRDAVSGSLLASTEFPSDTTLNDIGTTTIAADGLSLAVGNDGGSIAVWTFDEPLP